MMSATRRGGPAVTLVVICLGTFLVLLDASGISVALPTIQFNLHTSLSDLQWVVDAYTLPFAILLLPANTFGDRFGRRRLFLGGLILFLVGTLLCMFAPIFGWLIAGRMVQGIGAAGLASGSFSILLATFSETRARAIAIWSVVSGAALPSGTLAGGFLIQMFNWPAIFFVSLAIGLLTLGLAGWLLAESRSALPAKIDVAGLLLLTGWLTCLTVAIIASPSLGWTSPLILGLLAGSLLLLTAFLLVEARVHEPLFPLRLFKNRVFSIALVGGLMHGFAALGTIFFFTQYFQGIQGDTVLAASLRTLPIPLGAFLIAPVAARLATLRPGPRLPVALGALMAGVPLLLLTRLAPDTSYTLLWWQLGLMGLGLGLMLGPLNMALISATPSTQTSVGASIMNTSRQIGTILGVAVLGSLALQQFSQNIVVQFARQGIPRALSAKAASTIAGSGALAGRVPQPQPLTLHQAVLNQAFVDALHGAFFIAGIGLLAIALLVTFLLYQKRSQVQVQAAQTEEPGKVIAGVI
jgi:EmrB/QacA subfamily drug resistance transporter